MSTQVNDEILNKIVIGNTLKSLKQSNMKIKKHLNYFTTLVFAILLILLIFNSCRKINTNFENEKFDTTEKFFETPSGTSQLTARVIEEIKKRNYKSNFVQEFAEKNGFAIWNKTLVQKLTLESNTSLTGSSSNEDTLVYIPLVLANTSTSNGFIRAVINDSIKLSFCLAQDYKYYPVNPTNGAISALKYTLFFMSLDYEVYGYNNFLITDKENILPNAANYNTTYPIKIKIESITSVPNLLSSYQEICWTGPTALSANNTCSCYTPTCTCTVVGCCAQTNCISIVGIDMNPPPGGGGNSPIGGGSPIGTSGGGGFDIPPYYPCIPNPTFSITNGLLPEPLPPCPPPSGGVGWTPIPTPPFNINNPCNVVDSLMKLTAFKNILKDLRDSCVLPYEKGYSFTNPLNSSTFDTIGYTGANQANGNMTVSMDLINPTDGFTHDHNNTSDKLPNFSAEDIYQVGKNFSSQKIKNFRTFTSTVVTNNSSYLMMITDSTQFMNFYNSNLNTKEDFDIFAQNLYFGFHYGDSGLTNLQNEVNFLNCIQSPTLNGTGIKIFKGNSDMTSFSPIKVLNGVIKPNPCN